MTSTTFKIPVRPLKHLLGSNHVKPCMFWPVVVKTQSTAAQRTRLEQLDDFEEGSVREVGDLSQQEYTAHIEQLNRELVQAWHDDQRVKALKIAIQV